MGCHPKEWTKSDSIGATAKLLLGIATLVLLAYIAVLVSEKNVWWDVPHPHLPLKTPPNSS